MIRRLSTVLFALGVAVGGTWYFLRGTPNTELDRLRQEVGRRLEVFGDPLLLQEAEQLNEQILEMLRTAPWSKNWNTSVFVKDGVVEFWGVVDSDAERNASRIAAEEIPGVVEVRDRRGAQRHPMPGI